MRRAIAPRRRLLDALIIVLAVLLVIGSPVLPKRLPGDVASASPVCDSFATGGNAQVLELQGVEYCLHVFSQVGSAAFVAVDPRITQVDYLIVGGGGGGAARDIGGGGGAGGVLTGVTTIDPGEQYAVVVGAGATRNTDPNAGAATGRDGAPSSLFGLTAIGGGGGAGYESEPRTGGSGGGGTGIPAGNPRPASFGAPGTDGQGFAGGAGRYPTTTEENPFYGGGGGGGATQTGRTAEEGRHGGAGIDLSATFGTSVGANGVFAGGGGGAGHRTDGNKSLGLGGAGGGGAALASIGGDGTPGTGGGGGASRAATGTGGAGGSGVVIVRYRIPPVSTSAACDGTVKQAGLTIAAGHGEVLYINTGQNERIDAGYVAYRVSSDTARSDLWVEVTDFTGGVVVPADPSQMASPLGQVSAGGSRTAFFMVAAPKGTRTAQSHRVNVYDRRPIDGVTRPLASCSFAFLEVQETIRANANRVDSITATSAERIGSEMVITVEGDTGTIGQGNRIDGRMVWLSPAGRSDWPVSSLRLERVEISFFPNANRNANQLLSTHTDSLLVNAASSPALPADRQQFYTATYRFRIIGAAAATAPIVAVAMISSGSQVKHTDLRSFSDPDAARIDLTSTGIDVTLQKDVRTTTVVDDDGTTVTYDLMLVNAGSDDLVVDEIVDTPDDDLTIVRGSVTYDGTAASNPTVLADGAQRFSGPFLLPAGATRVLTYEMRTETCAPGGEFSFTNTATARIGSFVVGSSTATRSVVNLAGACGVEEAVATVLDEQLDPEVVTGAATEVTRASATLAGTVDANGDSGSAVRFRIAEGSDLGGVSARTVAAGTTSGGIVPEGVSVGVTGLRADTTYSYRMEVERSAGSDIVGATRTFTTPPEPALPVATTGTATSVTTTTAVLEGTVDANQVAGGAKVVFEWEAAATCAANGSALAGSGFSSGVLQVDEDTAEDALVEGSSPTAMSHPIGELTADTGYCFRIVALHGAGHATQVVGDWVAFVSTARREQRISWSTRTDPLPAGGATTVLAVSRPADDASKTTGLSVHYESVDPAVCTVDVATGAVTAVATSGTCAITATQEGDTTWAPALASTISFPISPPVVTTSTLVPGRYQDPYAGVTLAAEGGDGSYSSWTVATGTGKLPAGVSLDASTGALSGTPTEAGTFRFSVTTVSNGIVSDERSLVLVVAKQPVTVAASSPTVTFGDPAPLATASYTGFLGGDTEARIDIPPTCTTAYAVGDNAGTSPSTSCAGGWSAVYTLSTFVPGTVTITPRALTLRALDAAKQNLANGDGSIEVRPDPAFSFALSPALPVGLALDDVIDRGTAGVTFTRAAVGTTEGETPGTYAITPAASLTTSAAANFTITFVNGALTIQTPLIVPSLTAADAQITYGEDLAGVLIASAMDGVTPVPGAFTFARADGTSVDATERLPAGTHTLVVRFTPDDGAAYYGIVAVPDIERVETTLTVTVARAPLAVTAIDVEKRAGAPDPTFQRTLSGLVDPGDADDLAAIVLTRVVGEDPGAYTISSSGGSHPDYSVTHVPALLYVTRLAVVTSPTTGIVTSDEIAASCGGLRPGSQARLLLLPGPVLLGSSLVAADGTCTLGATLPTSVMDGSVTMQLEGVSPLGARITTERTFLLSVGRRPEPIGPSATPSSPVGTEPPTNGAVDTTGPVGQRSAGEEPSSLREEQSGPVSDAGPTAPGPDREPDRVALPSAPSVRYFPGPPMLQDPDPRDTRDVDVRSRRPSRLEGERLRGFDTSEAVSVEMLGVRTVARFVLTDVSRIDTFAITSMLRTSARAQSADFVLLEEVEPQARAPMTAPLDSAVQRTLGEVLDVVGLAGPRMLAELEGEAARDWIGLTVRGTSYVPGTAVHLVVTSSPVVLASGAVDADGAFVLDGSLPLDRLGAGEHRIRVVGIRQVDGVIEAEGDDIRLTDRGLAEVRRFDVGSRAMVALVGRNAEGGSHVAVRIVNLDPVPPWWTLGVIIVTTVVVGRTRRRPEGRSEVIARWALPIVATSGAPSVILGWTSTATYVSWAGLALTVATAVLVAAIHPEDSGHVEAHHDFGRESLRYRSGIIAPWR